MDQQEGPFLRIPMHTCLNWMPPQPARNSLRDACFHDQSLFTADGIATRTGHARVHHWIHRRKLMMNESTKMTPSGPESGREKLENERNLKGQSRDLGKWTAQAGGESLQPDLRIASS